MHKTILILLSICVLSSCADKPIPKITILKQEEVKWDKKVKCKIAYFDGGDAQEFAAKIKYRGGMSSKYYKHSFTVELAQKVSWADLPRDDDWVLNANYIDKTFMRHKISYDLFREMSPRDMASKSAYVTVYLDTIYDGLYLLMEKMNAGLLKLNKQDTMAMLFKDPPIFYKERKTNTLANTDYYEQKYPKPEEKDKTWYIEKFKSFLFDSDDHTFASEIGKWVDVDNIMDWHIMLLFSNNRDGITKNFYLYKKDTTTPFRIAIWDYDHSFGRDGDNELNMGEQPLDWYRSILLKRLVEIDETGYRAEIKKRWFELRDKNILSLSNFKKLVAANDNRIKDAVTQNFDRWPVNNDWYFDDNGYQQEVDLMIEFLEAHLRKIDAYMEANLKETKSWNSSD